MGYIYSFQVHLDPNSIIEKETIDIIEKIRESNTTKKQILISAIKALEEKKQLDNIISELVEIKNILESTNFIKTDEYTKAKLPKKIGIQVEEIVDDGNLL